MGQDFTQDFRFVNARNLVTTVFPFNNASRLPFNSASTLEATMQTVELIVGELEDFTDSALTHHEGADMPVALSH